VVVFTQGRDSRCDVDASCTESRRALIAATVAAGVSIYPVNFDEFDETPAAFHPDPPIIPGALDEGLAEIAASTGGAYLHVKRQSLVPAFRALHKILDGSIASQKVTMRLTAKDGRQFTSGSMLHGTLVFRHAYDPDLDCADVIGYGAACAAHLPFAVRLP
jgi:hypothetical protein